MKDVVRFVFKIFIYAGAIVIVPIMAMGYWSIKENNLTYWQAIKEFWGYIDY